MMLELAVGDAYGAGFEYADSKFVHAHNDLTGYVRHPWHKECEPGNYTDDTQMSIAIAEVLVERRPWTPENIADAFVLAFHRDQRKGYSGGFYKFLKSVKTGKKFLEGIRPDSDKSGAAMRAAPIGVLPDIEEVKERSTVQARVTHDTPDGVRAAVAAALMPHYFIYGLGPRENLGNFLEGQIPGEWARPWTGKVGSKGWMSVQAAVTVVERCSKMSELLRQSISFTGDVDTVATLALAAGSCCAEIEQDLPVHLVMKLENHEYGREYLLALDTKLVALRGKARET